MCWCVQALQDQQQAAANSPGNTGQLAAGLAGLLAVPVVAWSEYTLKTTGKKTNPYVSFLPILVVVVGCTPLH